MDYYNQGWTNAQIQHLVEHEKDLERELRHLGWWFTFFVFVVSCCLVHILF